jgi:mono/diheme cytochrome c family protein
MKNKYLPLITVSFLLLTACGDEKTNSKVTTEQQKSDVVASNFNQQEVMRGEIVFKNNCQTCHGEKGIGQVENWRKALPNGKYPAPPLNGTGHTWHHSGTALLNTINSGGIAIGGTMPPFKDVLSDKDKRAVFSYIQSLWPEKIYQMWLQKNGGK